MRPFLIQSLLPRSRSVRNYFRHLVGSFLLVLQIARSQEASVAVEEAELNFNHRQGFKS